ncbi:MAG: acyl-CoA dehydrogenase family protein [Acidimicrobiales bacterium]
MDFELSADQVALAELVRVIVAGRFPLDRVRRAEGGRQVVDPDDWAALAEAGVFSLTLPEAAGGAGLGLADAAVVYEELGRGLVPGPLVPSHLAARLAAGGVAPLDGAADGSLVVGAVLAPADGQPWLVEHLDSLGALVVRGPGGRLAAVPDGGVAGLVARARAVERSLDPLTPLSVLAGPPAAGVVVDDPAAVCEWDLWARVLTGALCVGVAAAACHMAVDHALHRHQFGRPVGSFQAVKHLCADMLVRSETARAAVQAAAVTVDQPGVGDAERAAAGGALLAAEAAVANARSCIQVFGGMGFTWEVPVHLYLERARFLAASLGPPDALAGTVAGRY